MKKTIEIEMIVKQNKTKIKVGVINIDINEDKVEINLESPSASLLLGVIKIDGEEMEDRKLIDTDKYLGVIKKDSLIFKGGKDDR